MDVVECLLGIGLGLVTGVAGWVFISLAMDCDCGACTKDKKTDAGIESEDS